MKRLTIRVNACTETLSLMIAMAWADGRLDEREKSGVRGAAQVLNLPKEKRERLDSALEKAPKVADLELAGLTAQEKAFAYVAASWMSGVDTTVDPAEKALLDEAAGKLGLAAERRAELEKIARSLEPLPEGSTAWGEEVTRLFKAIPVELEEPGGDFEVVFE
jgi:uncharacterized membrane protein YebE (DUF533 family)